MLTSVKWTRSSLYSCILRIFLVLKISWIDDLALLYVYLVLPWTALPIVASLYCTWSLYCVKWVECNYGFWTGEIDRRNTCRDEQTRSFDLIMSFSYVKFRRRFENVLPHLCTSYLFIQFCNLHHYHIIFQPFTFLIWPSSLVSLFLSFHTFYFIPFIIFFFGSFFFLLSRTRVAD